MAHPGPQYSVADVHAGWVEALRAADNPVLEYNLHDRIAFYDGSLLEVSEGKFKKALTADQAIELAVNGLYSVLYRTHPDVLLVISGFLIPNDLLELARRRGTKVVVIHTESPYEDERQIEQAHHADLNLINDPTNLARFPANTLYIPHAYRTRVHHPGPPDYDLTCDFAFVGTAFESRIRLFEALDLDGLTVKLAGNWTQLSDGSHLRKYIATDPKDCLDNTEAVRLYRSAKVGLNYYRREGDDGDDYAGWAMGPREVEMAACGLFFLRDPRPEGDELFPMLPTFQSPAEASSLIRWWRDHEDQREMAAKAAMEAIADRTFENNVRALLGHLERN